MSPPWAATASQLLTTASFSDAVTRLSCALTCLACASQCPLIVDPHQGYPPEFARLSALAVSLAIFAHVSRMRRTVPGTPQGGLITTYSRLQGPVSRSRPGGHPHPFGARLARGCVTTAPVSVSPDLLDHLQIGLGGEQELHLPAPVAAVRAPLRAYGCVGHYGWLGRSLMHQVEGWRPSTSPCW